MPGVRAVAVVEAVELARALAGATALIAAVSRLGEEIIVRCRPPTVTGDGAPMRPAVVVASAGDICGSSAP